jgi:hypothetical protein
MNPLVCLPYLSLLISNECPVAFGVLSCLSELYLKLIEMVIFLEGLFNKFLAFGVIDFKLGLRHLLKTGVLLLHLLHL